MGSEKFVNQMAKTLGIIMDRRPKGRPKHQKSKEQAIYETYRQDGYSLKDVTEYIYLFSSLVDLRTDIKYLFMRLTFLIRNQKAVQNGFLYS
jgi:predicted metalloprotease with PDZ domain